MLRHICKWPWHGELSSILQHATQCMSLNPNSNVNTDEDPGGLGMPEEPTLLYEVVNNAQKTVGSCDALARVPNTTPLILL